MCSIQRSHAGVSGAIRSGDGRPSQRSNGRSWAGRRSSRYDTPCIAAPTSPHPSSAIASCSRAMVPGSSQMSSSRNSAYRAVERARQGRPVLRDAVAGRMHHGVDAVPGRPQDPQERLRGRRVERRSPVGLVADDDVERVVLRGEPGERRRQLDGAVAGRDQDIELGGHRAPSGAGVARIRVTIAVVEWSDR